MVFSSGIFLFLFLPLVLILYYLPFIKSRTYKNTVLLLASIFFYAWGEPFFVFVMLAMIVINWYVGRRIEESTSHRVKKTLMLTASILDMSVLFVFKYISFVSRNIALLIHTEAYVVDIALPIGISFFTFQIMSYVFDIYYGKAKAQKSVWNVALYISMFPQLIAGPIVRYETVALEMENRNENYAEICQGACRFLYGLSKKVLLSNNMGKIADVYFASPDANSVLGAWLGAVAYTLQIYFDFSGYSDMAIGLGQMFGFHFTENFNYPYISKSVTEFWRRWHISLSTWFRDYIYIPLGGNRVKKSRLFFNLFVVWLFTGIWHGANWTFIAWGLLYYVFLMIEKILGLDKKGTKNIFTLILKHCYTMVIVICLWVIFNSASITKAWSFLLGMFGLNGNALTDADTISLLHSNAICLGICILAATPIGKVIGKHCGNLFIGKVGYILWTLFIMVTSIAVVINSSYNPFIYFNF